MVALAADEGEVVVASGLLVDDEGEFLFGAGELFAGGEAFGLKQALLDEFGAAGLDGKVGLGEGEFGLTRVAVLGDEVTSLTGENDVLDLACGAGAEGDHFVDVNKMVRDRLAGDFAGGFRLGNSCLVEVSPLGVAQELLKIAGEPVFDAAFGLLCVAFESGGKLLNLVGIHGAESG